MKINKLALFIGAEVFFVVAVSLALRQALMFSFAYLWLFFLPAAPLYSKSEDLVNQLVIINLFGLSVMTLIFFLIGFLITPLNKTIFLTAPVIIFIISFVLCQK